MFQWWYGHNAVGFFLTAGFLAIMYYFIPKRAERPIYSYRLSIIHFWALIFLYIWRARITCIIPRCPTGRRRSHDLLDHALDAVMGRHDQWSDDAVGRLGQAAHRSGSAHAGRVGRLLRHVDLRRSDDVDQGRQLAQSLHRLDHRSRPFRRLGWVGFVSFGALYCLVPWLWNRKELYSLKLVNWHFWIATIGIVLYISRCGCRDPAGPDVGAPTPRSASSNIPSSNPWKRCIRSTSSAPPEEGCS